MASYNKVILLGNLTRDVNSRQLQGGSSVGDFGLAVNHKFKGKDGQDKEDVLFIDCVAFGKTAEILAQYAQKGKQVLVEGRLKLESWEDKNGGGKRHKHVVVVDNFQLLGSPGDRGGQSVDRSTSQERRTSRPAPQNDGPPFSTADIPF
jgi:single-strand DNA-binding protein